MAKETFSRNKPDTAPPPPPPSTIDITLTMTLAAGTLTVAELLIDGSIDSDFRLVVFLTSSVGAGITKPNSGLLKAICAMDPVVDPSANDFLTPYLARFGSPQLGTKIFCKPLLIDRNSGRVFRLPLQSTIVNGT